MESYLRKLMNDGEGQNLDFKYCISDSRKIARTLSAFSNSDGGRILIGVRDNGSIAGIESDEEIYMVDTAAHLFCRPEIAYTVRQHQAGGKTIVEIIVEKGSNRPYQVKDEEGKWVTYFRHDAQNLVANRVLLQVWSKEGRNRGLFVKFSKPENLLMEYLSVNKSITFSRFRKLAGISAYRAEAILSNLIILKIIVLKASEKGFTYELNSDLPVK